MRRTACARSVALASIATVTRSACLAQSHPEYIRLGQLSAELYKPDSGPAPHVAFVLAHRTANYLNHIGCRELSARGFLTLCFNTRFQNNEASVRWEQIPLDVKAAVDFARSQPGIAKVILFGHSGGGPLMSFYQAVAEKGPGYCQAPERLVKCGSDLAGLKPCRRDWVRRCSPRKSGSGPAQPQSIRKDRRRQANCRFLARSFRSQEWLQPDRPLPLFERVRGSLFFGAGKAHERTN